MVDKIKYSTSQLLNFSKDSYFERTSRPVYAIVFLMPFIIFYEIGTFLLNTDLLNETQTRVVAFVSLQRFLEYIGFGGKFAWAAVPLAVVLILAGLQLASRKRWRIWLGDIWPMGVECVLLAVPLIVLSVFLVNGPAEPADSIEQSVTSRVLMRAEAIASCSSVTNEDLSEREETGGADERWQLLLAKIVTGMGAGIYEELLFRLILICGLMILFQDILKLNHTNSIVLAVLISAGLFSAHHHIIFLDGQLIQSSPFTVAEFVFRAIAGVYFAVVFAIRGFGITAGTHAFYDIIATCINAAFFQQ